MGMQVPTEVDESASAVSGRPSVVIVGPRSVGKHSLLKRLIANEELLKDNLSSDSNCQGWTIDTKYYTADVCIWTVRLDSKDNGSPPMPEHCEALLMVFDLSDPTTFENLQQWVKASDLSGYEVQICVGNKADRLPSHFGHIEYRRRLMKRGESSSDPHPEFMDFGIDRAEGSGLLATQEEDDDDPEVRRRACIEWCTEQGIEYIEACAINEAFDKCMSVDGDLQGVPRILDALSAHMWPGLVMKSTEKPTDVNRPDSKENDEDGEFSSDDEEDFLIEYEVLSNASTEPWDGNEDMWSFRGADAPPLDVVPSNGEYTTDNTIEAAKIDVVGDHEDIKSADASSSSSTFCHVASKALDSGDQIIVVEHSGVERVETSTTTSADVIEADVIETVDMRSFEVTEKSVLKNKKEHGAEDLEKMMHEMASMRENMRNMSDAQRREVAAQLAMRMATMFLDDDDEDDE